MPSNWASITHRVHWKLPSCYFSGTGLWRLPDRGLLSFCEGNHFRPRPIAKQWMGSTLLISVFALKLHSREVIHQSASRSDTSVLYWVFLLFAFNTFNEEIEFAIVKGFSKTSFFVFNSENELKQVILSILWRFISGSRKINFPGPPLGAQQRPPPFQGNGRGTKRIQEDLIFSCHLFAINSGARCFEDCGWWRGRNHLR